MASAWGIGVKGALWLGELCCLEVWKFGGSGAMQEGGYWSWAVNQGPDREGCTCYHATPEKAKAAALRWAVPQVRAAAKALGYRLVKEK